MMMRAIHSFGVMTLRLAVVLLFLVAAPAAVTACPLGIPGFANPHATVCAEAGNGTTWCAKADGEGNFHVTGASVPPSTGINCLPTTGTFYVYDIACPRCGAYVTRGGPPSPIQFLTLKCGCRGDGRLRAGPRLDHLYNLHRFELGGQVTSLNTRFNTSTEPGVGMRLTYNVLRTLALEAEGNLFPRESFTSTLGGGRTAQGFVGLKSGPRFKSFGVFGTARAGVQSFGEAVTGFRREGESFNQVVGRRNVFALNLGGGVELCPGGRVGVRFDVGDTVTFQPSRAVLGARGPVLAPRFTEQNLQVSSGIVYRFPR